MLNENLISDEIRAKYVRDPRIPHPAEVAVSERAGAVTLRGTVGTPQQRHAAVEIAKSVGGVRDVYDELSVDLRDHWDDAEIRGAALQALMSSPDVPADQIEVKVDAAWLTMKGGGQAPVRQRCGVRGGLSGAGRRRNHEQDHGHHGGRPLIDRAVPRAARPFGPMFPSSWALSVVSQRRKQHEAGRRSGGLRARQGAGAAHP
jgi:BON domain